MRFSHLFLADQPGGAWLGGTFSAAKHLACRAVSLITVVRIVRFERIPGDFERSLVFATPADKSFHSFGWQRAAGGCTPDLLAARPIPWGASDSSS